MLYRNKINISALEDYPGLFNSRVDYLPVFVISSD